VREEDLARNTTTIFAMQNGQRSATITNEMGAGIGEQRVINVSGNIVERHKSASLAVAAASGEVDENGNPIIRKATDEQLRGTGSDMGVMGGIGEMLGGGAGSGGIGQIIMSIIASLFMGDGSSNIMQTLAQGMGGMAGVTQSGGDNPTQQSPAVATAARPRPATPGAAI
jgi:hypothetical protein